MSSNTQASAQISAPTAPSLSPSTDSGSSDTDNLTSRNTPSFSGTAEAGTNIELFANGISLGSTTTDPSGQWTFSVPSTSPLADGSIAVTAIASETIDPTPATVQRQGITPASPGRTHKEVRNAYAFAALKDNGSVVTWGNNTYGGDSSSVASQLESGVSKIFSTLYAFAALKDNGSVVSWGHAYGGNSGSVALQLQAGVKELSSTGFAFAALKNDGSVVTWGLHTNGGDSSAVASKLESGVDKIFSTFGAFAALKKDGSVVTWGSPAFGSNSSSVASQLESGVSNIFSTSLAFAALKDNGSVITWGNADYGGNSSSLTNELSSDVKKIFSTDGAFAALKKDGSVVTWGNPDIGANSNTVSSLLQSNVESIFSTGSAFAALKKDGSVVTWGNPDTGGNSSSLTDKLSSGVIHIVSTAYAFAAIKDNGSVVTWGNADSGGNSTSVASQLESGVTRIVSTDSAFAAIKDNGSVVTWGNPDNGGNSSSLIDKLSSGVEHIISTGSAFAAIKDNGSVVTWGNPDNGGNSKSVSSDLESGVFSFANPFTNDRLIPANSGSKIASDPSQALNVIVDTKAPTFSSSGTATPLDEESGFNQLIYTATTSDNSPVTYSLKSDNNDDASEFSIDPSTGEVSFIANPNYEAQSLYSFTVVATDDAGNSAEKTVSLSINDLNDQLIPDLTATSDTGSSSIDNITRATTPSFTGIAEAGHSVELFADGSLIGTTTAADNGKWSFTTPSSAAFSDGTISITASAFDPKAPKADLQSEDIPVAYPGKSDQEFRNNGAFAALKDDGSVVTWGLYSSGGNSGSVSSQLTSGVTQIFSTSFAFAALKEDGSVVTWGNYSGDSSSVSTQLSSKVTQISSTTAAFAALTEDGSVVTWGPDWAGGNSSAVSSQLTSGVKKIFSTEKAFAALKEDGSIVTWGSAESGGDSRAVSSKLSSGVKQIFSTSEAFAALKNDGEIVAWGDRRHGGDNDHVSDLQENILGYGNISITSNPYAFTAYKNNKIISWGDSRYGGDSRHIAHIFDISKVISNDKAFAALRPRLGDVLTWGHSDYGFDRDNQSRHFGSDVKKLFSTKSAFAALTEDGSVHTWGQPSGGGDSSSVSSQLTSDVEQIFSTSTAFAALKRDGSVVTWGGSGGDSSSVSGQLTSDVKHIFTTGSAFAALKKDGSVVTWGGYGGGNSSAVSDQIRSGVISFADPFQNDLRIPLTSPTPSPLRILVDTTAPSFQSNNFAEAIDENSGANQVVYTATATDNTSVTYNLKANNNDHAEFFSIDSSTGKITLNDNPDYEKQTSYKFTVVATDAAGNASEQSISLAINDLVEPPAPPSRPDLNAATDSGSSVSDNLTNNTTPTFSGTAVPNTTIELFADGSSIGTTTADNKGKWSFTTPTAAAFSDGSRTITATSIDPLTSMASRPSTGLVIIIDSTAPTFTSSGTATAIDENSGSKQLIYTATATDNSSVTYTLKSNKNEGESAFAINSSTGEVNLTENPNYEAKSAYSFTIIATDEADNSSEHSVSLAINDVDDPATSPTTPDLIDATDSGSSISDNLTNNTTPTFTGSAEAGATIELFADSSALGTTTANSSGEWTFSTPTSATFSDGTSTITATAKFSANPRAFLKAIPISPVDPGRTTQEWRNAYAFAALKRDGSVVTWGNSALGGDSHSVSDQLDSGVEQIFSTQTAFAALKKDGSVITWGDSLNGGDSRSVSDQLDSGVEHIFSTQSAFAALKKDGSVVTWGDSAFGGESNSLSDQLGSGVKQLFSTQSAFAALKKDGSVITWGDSLNGGDSRSVSDQLDSGVEQIFSTRSAFAALKEDDSVVTWGDSLNGGDSHSVSDQLDSGVEQIFSTRSAFAALKEDDSVVTWGNSDYGGDSTPVGNQIDSNVSKIFSHQYSFAALKKDGSVVTWGNPAYGGNSTAISSQLASDVKEIFAADFAFAALKEGGSVVTWGATFSGGDSSSVSSQLTSDVEHIFTTGSAFAALKKDGSVVTWGPSSDGDSSSVSSQLTSDVEHIFTTSSAFAALKKDGSVVTWGYLPSPPWGIDSSSVSADLQSDVISFADPFQDDRRISFTSKPSTGLTITVDTSAPTFTSSGSAPAIDDNSGANQVVYTATATDNTSVTYSLKANNNDHAESFSIDSSTGKITLNDNPNYEKQSSYSFTVVATDAAGNSSEQSVALAVDGRDDTPPTAPSKPVLNPGSDSGSSDTDNLTLNSTPSFTGTAEANSSVELFAGSTSLGSTTTNGSGSWSFTVPESTALSDGSFTITAVATDAAGNASPSSAALSLTVDSTAPSFTSGDSAKAIDENSGAKQLIYTATTTDNSSVTYSLKTSNNDDAESFSIDSSTGKITLNGDPNYEKQSSYSFTIVATDAAGNSSEQSVSLAIKDRDDAANGTLTISGSTGPASWQQLGADIDGITTYGYSGTSVSLSADGSTVAIGAKGNDRIGDNTGQVRIYRRNSNGDWQQLGADIDGEAAGDKSGYSVSLSADGTTVAIGAPHNGREGERTGHVRIYELNSNGDWQQLGTDIDGEAVADSSGWNVSLSDDGTTVAIGAPYNSGNGSLSGHVRIYQRNSDGNWKQLGTDIDGEDTDDRSAWSVSLSADGSTVAIGAIFNDGSSNLVDPRGSQSGHVRIYRRNSDGKWEQLGADIDGEAASDKSGNSVSLSADGSIVAIASRENSGNGYWSGHVRIYQLNSSHDWKQLGADIDGEAAGDNSGYSISLSDDGSTIAIGAPHNSGNGDNAGHVRIYQLNSKANTWQQLGTDIDGEAADDYSGKNISLSADGSTIAIGADGNSGNGSSASHVRIYQLQSPTYAQQGDILSANLANALDPDGDIQNITYQWQSSSDNGISWTDLSGETKQQLDTSAPSLAGKDIRVVATTKDAADGFTTFKSAAQTILDVTPPAAPSAPVLNPGSDSGSSDTDNLTLDSTPSFTGTAEANSSVELFAGTTSLGSTTTNGSGSWSFTIPESAALSDGSFAITAVATDAAANESPSSAALSLTVDSTAPTFTSGDSAKAIDENSGAKQLIYTAAATDNSSVTYSLKANNNDHAESFSIDSSTGKITLNSDPDYEKQSSYSFTVVATDAAGNSSEQSVSLAIKDRDDTPPTAPSTPVLNPGSDSGRSDTDNLTLDSTPSFTGTAEANSSVELFAGTTSLGSTTTNGSGSWSFTVPESAALSDGSFAITAVATDAAGNTSLRSADLNITIDATAPTFTSGGSAAAISENSGSNQLIYTATATDTSPITYSLKTNNNDDAPSFSIESTSGKVTLNANPDYESKSSYAFTVVATDSAGNTSEQPVTLKVNDLDDTAPPAPSTPVLTPASDSGRSDTDNLTNNRTPSFTGTAEANSSIELFAGNTSLGSTKTDSSGNWSFTVPESAPLTDGSFAITALATDSAGNTSLRSAALNITIDTTAPTFTSGASAAAINENSGSNQLIYTATATDTSPLTYSLKTNNNDDATSFSIDSTSGKVTLNTNPDYEAKSSYAFTVVATDSAGNTSEQPVTLKVNDFDDTAPPAPSKPALTPASDSGRSDTDNLTNNRTPSFTGTAEANSSIELFAGNTALGSTKTDSSGNWSFTVPESASLTDGSFAITALATDSAGNTSLRSADLNITIDATTPTFTSGGSAAAINENSGSNQLIYTATATDTSPLNYSLKTNNNDDSGFFSIDSSTGAVTLTANPDYESKSSYAFTVVATDSAGNTSEQPVTLKVNDLANEASYQYSGFNSSFDFISQSSPAAQIGPKDYATAFELENRFKSSLSNSILITFEADNGWLDVNGAYPDSFTPDDHQLLAGSSSPYSSFSPAAPGTNARTTLVPATSAGQHANGSAQGTIEYIHADTSQNSGRRVHFNLSNVGHVAGVDEPDLARLNQYSNIDRGVNVTSGNDLVTNSEYDQFLEILPSEQTEGGLNVYFTGTKAGSGDSFSNPVNAFGFYLMGREDKRDVYLDVYDIAGNLIHSAPTKEPDNPSEAVVEYITFTLDSDSNNSPIASFSLREEWKNGNGPSQRDIFSIDNLSLEFASGNNQSTDPLNPTNSSNNIKLSASHLNARGSQSISIPIVISDAAGIESLDLNLTYDTSIFDQPTTRPLITAGSLNSGSSFVINNNPPGQVAISWAGTSPLPAGSGSIATLNLEVKADASVGSSLIDLVSASINENAISTSLVDGSITLLPPSFQIIATRQLPNGLALQLPEAPDLDALNLYDGPDTAIDTPDLLLSDADGKPIALSAHWQEDSKELFLLANEPFTAGDYNLSIDSRADGLISASSGELLDGDGDGKAGDALSTSISFSAPEHSLSIADTARGAGQSLSPNGRNTHDPVTGAPLETSRGLPIHLSTSSSLTAFSGQISYDSSLLHNNQLDSALTTGSDLPADWTLQINPSSTPGKLNYSASGSTPITGNNQQILRFHATVATNAAPPANATTGNGLYGSSTLINASFSSDQITGQPIAIDPGLIALAYAGDTTGDGTLSSLDALHVQRVVVRLDSGFDAYDKLNPVLIGDTTGNGTLSSLDASRIQQKVVELPVDTFPGIPQQ